MILLQFGGTLTVGDESLASNTGTLEITDDSAVINLSVDTRATVAFAERFQRLGIRVDYDRGDGVMVTFPSHTDLGDSLVIDESADGFGDDLTFVVAGEKWAPFARQVLTARTKVEVYFVTGSPQNEFSAKVFTGWIVSSTYDVHPPATRIHALDAAALHAEKMAHDWSLPPNSGRTRLEITMELLTIGGIAAGSLSMGPNGGGIVNKPHTTGGRPIIEFLRDFLAVIGVDVGFENGLFVASALDLTLPPVTELTPANLLPDVSIASPDTLSANVLGVVSTATTRTEVGGVRTLPERCVITRAVYAPMSYAGPLPPADRIITKICTKESFLGTLDVHTEQTTWSWYAVLAAGARLQAIEDPPGWEIVPTLDTVYIYPDGTTRADWVEHFRRTGKIVRDKQVDANLNVIRKTEAKYFFHFLIEAPFLVVAGVDEVQNPEFGPAPQAFHINDDGQAVIGGREVMGLLWNDSGSTMEGGLGASVLFSRPDSFIETDYTLDEDGAIIEEVTKEHYYDIGEVRRRADGTYGYGAESVVYTDRPAESYLGATEPWGGLKVVTRRYRAIDEDRYEITQETRIGSAAPTTDTPVAVIGSLPRPERAEPTQSSQELRATYEDHERIAMAGGERIESIEHNEFIETQAEAEFYARLLAMKASAKTLTATMPIEGLIHKRRMVRVNVPGAAIEGLAFAVRSVRRDASAFSQTVTADYYAPGI